MLMGQLAAFGYAKQKDIADAFDVSVQTVRNNMKQCRKLGMRGFFMPKTPYQLRAIDEEHRIKGVQIWHGGIESLNFNGLRTRNSVDAGFC